MKKYFYLLHSNALHLVRVSSETGLIRNKKQNDLKTGTKNVNKCFEEVKLHILFIQLLLKQQNCFCNLLCLSADPSVIFWLVLPQ